MKFNKWTLGLAAVGVVSLASVAQAEEKNAIQTALSATTISGYVDTSIQWNPGTGTDSSYYKFGQSKDDGFNLNVVQLSLAKPLDEGQWAAGYKVDLWFGPDANVLGTTSTEALGGSSDFAIRQAYVALRVPVGNGIDCKVGVFDSIIGYESVEAGNNPNFTRSYGHTMEPQTHTGVLATYRFNDMFSASAGIANTVGATINDRAHWNTFNPKAESYKTYMASVALTAPSDWGSFAGSTLYAGVVNGFSASSLGGIDGPGNQTSWYVGATVATPVTGLKIGAAYDLLDYHSQSGSTSGLNGDAWAGSLYASYQATEKLSLHARGELAQINGPSPFGSADNIQVWAATATVQYALWENVISRLEARWDHSDEGRYFSSNTGSRVNSILLAANIIYKF